MTTSTTFDSTKRPLFDLLQAIEEGRTQLPDFQRSWVWDDEHVRGLLASISLSYPIGTVMLLETGNADVKLKPRLITGVELHDPPEPDHLILDGQQRLTSLYLALLSGKPVPTRHERIKRLEFKRVYYIDMEMALDSEADREEAVIGVDEDGTTRMFAAGGAIDRDYSTPEKEYESRVFPVSRLFNASQWRHAFNQHWNHDPAQTSFFDRFEEDVIDRFKQYLLPVIEMDKVTPKDAVCQIFEKVNTGGVSLNVFELLTATYAADNFNLREDWESRYKSMRSLKMSEPPSRTILDHLENTDFLQAITLMSTRARRLGAIESGAESDKVPGITCKRKDVLKLALGDYKLWADKVTDGFIAAAKLLHTQNIFSSRDLPYRTQLVPLAALIAALGEKAENASAKEKLLRWYWCGVLGELYGGAIESRFAKDLPEVLGWIEGKSEPSTVQESSFAPARLLTLRTRNSAAYKGLYALLMRQQARDLRTGDAISHQSYFEENIDIHHIFPKKWCVAKSIDRRRFDSIVNKTPLSAKTNRIIGGNAPSKYLLQLQEKTAVSPQQMDGFLETHLILPDLMRANNFDSFFESRKEGLVGLIESATGKLVDNTPIPLDVIEAADAEEEDEEDVA